MGYESAYNSHWMKFDHRRIDTLGLVELQDHLSKEKITKKTQKEAVGVLRWIFACAVTDKAHSGVTTNIIDDWVISKSKNDRVPEPDPYTLEERDKLLDALHEQGQHREADMIAWRYCLTGFFTGMRTGELLGIMWSDYDNTGEFHVWQERVRRKMQPYTKTKERDLILIPKVIEMLSNNPTRFSRSHIFLSPEGHPFRDADWLMVRWRRAHETMNVRRRLGPYQWRHTFISQALVKGLSINDVAQMSGNSPTTIEKHYLKWMPGTDDKQRLREEMIRAFK